MKYGLDKQIAPNFLDFYHFSSRFRQSGLQPDPYSS